MNTIETIRFLGAGLPLLLCILAEARLLTLLRDDRSGWLGAMAIAVAVLAIPLAFMYFRSRRRLSRTVRLFHSVESRRTRTTYVPIVAGTLAGAGAILYLGGRLFLDDPSIAPGQCL